jgi:hypothetical protein
MDILQKLPNELLLHLLAFSNAKDILSCAAVRLSIMKYVYEIIPRLTMNTTDLPPSYGSSEGIK